MVSDILSTSAELIMLETPKTVFLLVLLWWIANGLTSLYSKTEMSKQRDKNSFLEMKWLDLTILQFLFGVMGSAFCIYFIEGRSLSIQNVRDSNSFVVILGNLVGHLSVNVSYTFVSSSATQVVKSSEPIFMFLFLICLRSQAGQKQNTSALVLFSIILMVFGTCLFVIWDITFNVWGIVAAVVSNIAFPLRNIALKNIVGRYESAFQKYFILSFCGTLALFPFLVLKLIIHGTSLFHLSQSSTAAASFHCVYNLASISVLQNVSPLNHAILNFSKRVFVIILNIKYFDINMTWQMFVGLVVIFSGLAIYLFSRHATSSLNMFLIRPTLKMNPRRFFVLVGFLTLLSTFVYLAPLHENITNQHTSNFDINSVNHEASLNAAMNRDISEMEIATTWVFNRPILDVFIEEIVTVHKQTGASIHVYCGTMMCLDTIKKLKNPMITASFLVIPNVLENTPLQTWGERHALYKVLAGLHYEWYLTQALCLAHVWQYGGIFYLPSYKMARRASDSEQHEEHENGWPCMLLKDIAEEKSFNIIQLSPKNQVVRQQIDMFLRNMEISNSTTLPDIFQDTVWNAFSRHCPNRNFYCWIWNRKSLRDLYTRQGIPFEDEYHFGTLSFDGNVGPKNRPNTGDEIQAIAGIQFLPFIDFFLDREYQKAPDTNGKHTVFFNAWWGNRKLKWPPSENIDPVMLSVHTEERFRSVIASSSRIVSFLKSKAPIGARDMITKRFMESIGVRSFFAGCMTLFLRKPHPAEKRDNTIYINDLSHENINLLPQWIVKKAKFVKHTLDYGWGNTLLTQERFVDAYKILEKYSHAKLVITRRIHAALPCVAMGTPVIFFNSAKMPGGGGSTVTASERVKGLVDLFHSIDLYNITVEQAKEKLRKFNWTNPPSNPNLASRMQMVSSMWFIMRKNKAIHESARRFGMLPLTPQWLTKVQPSHVVHIIHDDTSQDVRSSGGLKWHQWRCIESILRHHPTSRLFVYSNTIQQSVFDVLTEVGYQVNLRNYKLSDLVEQTPLKEFFNQFNKTSSDEISMKKILHEHGILRLLLLYKHGGMYLAENTIVLKAIDISQSNVLSLDSESYVNPWMLNFERNHEFLRDVLEKFLTIYSPNAKSDEGKALLTKVRIIHCLQLLFCTET